MRSSNPMLSGLAKDVSRSQHRTAYAEPNPYGGYQAEPIATPQANYRPMTVDDVVTKTGITLAVIVAGAIVNYAIAQFNPGLAAILTMVGAIGGLITVLVSSFSKKYGSAAITLTYAAFEGFFVGGISNMFAAYTVGNTSAGALIGQAVIGTIGVFLGMLFVYKTGAVKVTPKFNRILNAAIVGALVVVVANLLGSLIFKVESPLYSGGLIAIGFTLFLIVLAALSFLQDFDVADRLIRQGAPANMAWGVALGLAVTLVWLYTEVLRLLSYLQNR